MTARGKGYCWERVDGRHGILFGLEPQMKARLTAVMFVVVLEGVHQHQDVDVPACEDLLELCLVYGFLVARSSRRIRSCTSATSSLLSHHARMFSGMSGLRIKFAIATGIDITKLTMRSHC